MYSHVDHRRNKAFLKQLFSIFLIFTLYFNSINSAYASTAMGGWSLSNPVAKGASTLYNGAKNVLINGKNVAKTSTALITPTASQVAKLLGKGVAGVALSVAVEQMLGAVDWVLDPVNNQIKYNTDSADPADPSNQYYYTVGYTGAGTFCGSSVVNKKVSSLSQLYSVVSACFPSNIKPTGYIADGGVAIIIHTQSNGNYSASMYRVLNPAYDPNAEKEQKTLPLDVVAQQVISNAESGDTNAQVATTAAAADIVNDAQNDSTKARPIVNQLEANAETKTEEEATGQSKPNTETGATDLSLTFPVFCGWAPVVCEAAQTVISFPQTITNWWETGKSQAQSWANSIAQAYTATKEWLQDDKDNSDSDNDPPEITQIDIGQLDTGTFRGTAGCPQPIQVPVNMGSGGNVEISYEPICSFASKWSFVAPLIGFLSGAMIIVGVGRKGEDSEI